MTHLMIDHPTSTPTPLAWPGHVDEILAGDQVLALAHLTPARGVVLSPLTNTGLRDRAAGRIAPVSSSVGMWRKLERVRADPKVALAYHTRDHAFTGRPEYVLVQGTASLTCEADADWVNRHLEAWERFAGPRDVGPLWEWWLRDYHRRVGIEVEVERVLVWPDLACRGPVEVHGAPLPEHPPAPQAAPAKGTSPRVNHRRAARRAGRLPHILLGWAGADGFPVVVPVEVAGAEERGIVLDVPSGLVPPGGRRAGLAAHEFAPFTYGQRQRRHTGWLDGDSGERCVYSPHTESWYWIPWSRTAYRLEAGYGTRRGVRQGRRAGVLAS